MRTYVRLGVLISAVFAVLILGGTEGGHADPGITSPSTATALAAAMEIPPGDMVTASLGTSDPLGAGVGDTPLSSFPLAGGTFTILSSGLASSADDPDTNNGECWQCGGADDDVTYVLDGLNNSQGNDLVQLSVTLSVPGPSLCLAFDFAFYSEEFPDWMGSAFNDTFIAELGAPGSASTFTIVGDEVVAPNNIAFDPYGNTLDVNTGFGFDPANQNPDTGTTYDGTSGLLTARTPVEPGTQVEIVFSIMDLGDSILDSAVFLDNFRWTTDPPDICKPGIVLPEGPHYQCYQIAGHAPGIPVDLQTQFGFEPGVMVGQATLLCAPALKNGEGELDLPHLKCYDIVGEDPSHIVNLATQFGVEENVEVGPATRLCVPADKEVLFPEPVPPSGSVPEAPHYECYEIDGLPPAIPVDLETQFGLELGVDVWEPALLCAPALKNDEGDLYAPHLKCYDIVGEDPPHIVNLETQFGFEWDVAVDQAQLLCVWALKDVFDDDDDDDNDGWKDYEEVPGGGGADPAGDTVGSNPFDPFKTPEVCDGIDNDQDGVDMPPIDEGFEDSNFDGEADCHDDDFDADGDGIGNATDPNDDSSSGDAFEDWEENYIGTAMAVLCAIGGADNDPLDNNADGKVTIFDIMKYFEQVPPGNPPAYDSKLNEDDVSYKRRLDIYPDGVINILDIMEYFWLNQYGQYCPYGL